MHTDCRSLLPDSRWSILELISNLEFSWHFTCDNSAIEERDIEK
jgi:hypothetical protein